MEQTAATTAPAETTTTEPSAPATAAPTVIDLALFGELRTVQALRNSGIIPDDEAQSKLQVIKRLNHALHTDAHGFSPEAAAMARAAQSAFRQAAQGKEFEQVVSEGLYNELYKGYLEALIADSAEKLRHLDNDPLVKDESNPHRLIELHAKQEQRKKKYEDELAYYGGNPQPIQEAARQYKELTQSESYLPMGRIVAMSGVAGSDQAFALDLVSDVMGVQSARHVKSLARHFPDEATLARYAGDPAGNAVRLQAMALVAAKSTASLDSLREFERETPELDRIVALKTLLSAQLHQAMTDERTPAQLAEVAKRARVLVREHAQVAMSLAYHFISSGPAAQDARSRTVQANLDAEMRKDGIALLAPAEALRKAGEVGRRSAEDLLTRTEHDGQLKNRLTALAAAAGTDVAQRPLNPRPNLIGVDLLTSLQPLLDDPNILTPPDVLGFLKRELNRRSQSPEPAAGQDVLSFSNRESSKDDTPPTTRGRAA